MSLEWIVTGIILLGAMTACGISLYIKKRKESQTDLLESGDVFPDLPRSEKDET